MKIQVLGTGCAKCKALEKNAREAVSNLGVDAEVVKVEDPDDIIDMGVMMTPALGIDGDIKLTGKVATVEEIEALISGGN